MGEPHGSPKYCTMSLLASNEGLAVGLVAYGSIGFLVQKEEARVALKDENENCHPAHSS